MAGEGAGEELSSSSPKNRVKFLCSHGGKILPRPGDNHLKYVGGDTRVVAVPRDIIFSELKKRLTSLYDGDMVLKYQLIYEDLDALVSVRNDEDLKHMLDEYDRQENEGTPRLRTFLFPSKPTILDNQAKFFEPHALEQRYVDAINGIIRRPKLTPIDVNHSSFSISSACSSPDSPSPELHTVEPIVHETNLSGYQNSRVTMHKVQSSPSLCSLDNFQHHSNHNAQQQQYYYHYYGGSGSDQNQHHHYGYQLYRPPIDPHKGLAPALSMGRAEIGRSMMGHSIGHYHTNSHNRHQRGSGSGTTVCNKCGFYEESTVYGCSPRSPRKDF